MALVVFDRVQETTATTGTGTITLGGAVTGFQSFAVVGNGNTTFYCITNNAQWEVGIGTYSTTGPTLARTTVLSNSDGNTSPITLVGPSNVFVTYPSEKSVNLDASGNVSPLGTIASGTWQGTTVASGYGGTGLTTFTAANNALYSTSASALTAGTLPVAAGGTGTSTAFTAGSVVFAGASGTYSQDNAQLFWDDTNNRLGLGVNNPSVKLDVQGTGTDHLFRALNTGTAASDDSILLIQTSGTGTTSTISGLYFGDGDSQSIGRLNYNHSDNSMALFTNSTEQMRITSAGGISFGATGSAYGSSGQILQSNGNAAPTWITTLGVANGGTGTSTAFTAGSVVFAGASGTYSQDNAQLFWDDTNNRLGIGTATPSSNGGLTVSSAGATNYITITAGSISSLVGTDANGLALSALGSNNLILYTSGTERMRIDSSGNVGIGVTPTLAKLHVYSSISDDQGIYSETTGSGAAFNGVSPTGYVLSGTTGGLTVSDIYSTDASASGMNIYYRKEGGSPADGDSIALLRFFGEDSALNSQEYCRITTLATDVTSGTEDGELRFSTVVAGALSSAMRLVDTTQALIPAVYNSTTASAANVFVASSGLLSRSTSSIQYKTQVEDLAQPNSANIYNMRPVWYRSTCANDNKNWSWYGLIAEEVAELDPRLVHWGYADDQYDITYVENDGQKEEVKTLKENAVMQPEGVQYDRLTVLLIQEMKALKAEVESLKAEVQVLKGS